MTRRAPAGRPGDRPNGAVALILHRPHATVDALARQLRAIGLAAVPRWPDLEAGDDGAHFLFFDADQCHDAQLPWPAGHPPMPMIALIGSEAPGRVGWALDAGAVAQMVKPVGAAGAHAALMLASRAFASDAARAGEAASLRARVAAREDVVAASLALAARGDRRGAYATLRRKAMDWQVTIEVAALRVLREEGADDRDHG